MGWWSKVKSAFKTVAKVALVVVAIVAPEIIPAIGASILPAGASVAATTAAGAATITTASSLAQGNSIDVALKQGAVAGVTSFVGISTATNLQSASAGAAAGSAAGTVVAKGSIQDIIRNAVAGGVGAGVGDTTGSTALGKGAGTLVASGGNINAAINSAVSTELTSLASQGVAPYVASAKETLSNIVSPPSTTPEQQAAADAQKLVDTSKAQPGTQLAQADTGTATDAGGALSTVNVTAPKYQAGSPENVLPYTTTDVTKPSGGAAGSLSTVTVTAPKYQAGAPENVLPYTSTDVTGTTTPTSDKQPLAQKPADATSEKVIKPSLYFTGVAPTGGALAQGLGTSFSGVPTTGTSVGLTGERGAGEIESKETGKARQNVWNEASLRLKDALGV
jgi:hypothetical protein